MTNGEIDYETGLVSLGFNSPPRTVIELRDVAFESANVSLANLGFYRAVTGVGDWLHGGYSLNKDSHRGADSYSSNPRDAGLRMTLPGVAGRQSQYFAVSYTHLTLPTTD
mgnify:CR=1 FL=1